MVSPDGVHGGQFLSLEGEASLHNLTLDQVQSQLGSVGKSLNSMKLGELLRNVISVEDGRPVIRPPSSSSSSSSSCSSYSSSLASIFVENFILNGRINTNKTVEEIWGEILRHGINADQSAVSQRLNNLGETTLDDFLYLAGVSSVENQNHKIVAIDRTLGLHKDLGFSQIPMEALLQQQKTVMESSFQVCESLYENPSLETGYFENQLAMVSMPVPALSATSSDSNGVLRRGNGQCSDETRERRQRRMLKNRESAARSRARKQAYTNQLEHEVFLLRKTNAWLKKQEEIEILLRSNSMKMPRYQLRRTSSACF